MQWAKRGTNKAGCSKADKLSRAVCEWSKGLAKELFFSKQVLQVCCKHKAWRLFCFKPRPAGRIQKRWQAVARSDQQASFTPAALGFFMLTQRYDWQYKKRQRSCQWGRRRNCKKHDKLYPEGICSFCFYLINSTTFKTSAAKAWRDFFADNWWRIPLFLIQC